jgi:hypothetical protein
MLNCHKQKKAAHGLLILGLIASLLSSAILSGCTGTPSESQTEATTAASMTPTANPTTTVSTTAATTTESTTSPSTSETTVSNATLNPLTGEPLISEAAAGQRPIALMINNIRIATPQIGIGKADLIYEMPVEGGITRLLAVFADVTAIPEIGSIRSARHDYVDLCGGLDAILVHVGGSPQALQQISDQNTTHIDMHAIPGAFWRDPAWISERGLEHSVKTNGQLLQKALIDKKFRTKIRAGQKPAFLFRPDGEFAPADGSDALKVSAPFSSYCVATFTYDPATRLYGKGEFGKPQIDLATGQALQFVNIFLIKTSITLTSNHKTKEIDLGKGSGLYITGGKAQPIKWRKGLTGDSFVFTDLNGAEIMVNAGKSYIGVLSLQANISVTP